MRIAQSKPLFAWDCLEDSPSLTSIRELIAAIPDGKLLESLRSARGKGRNDCPVHVLWGVVVLTAALRHADTEKCLGQLRRNEGLRRLIAIEAEKKVPTKSAMSRFEDALGSEPHLSLLQNIFNVMVERLGAVVPDLGKDTAGDATSLSTRRKRSSKVHAKVGTVLIVHAAFAALLASAPRHEGTLGKPNLSPIAKALQTKLDPA